MVNIEGVRLQDCIAGLSLGNRDAGRVVLEVLELFADSNVTPDEVCWYFLLLSSRGYVGARLVSFYTERADCDAAQALNLVVEEAWRELLQSSQLVELEEACDRR